MVRNGCKRIIFLFIAEYTGRTDSYIPTSYMRRVKKNMGAGLAPHCLTSSPKLLPLVFLNYRHSKRRWGGPNGLGDGKNVMGKPARTVTRCVGILSFLILVLLMENWECFFFKAVHVSKGKRHEVTRSRAVLWPVWETKKHCLELVCSHLCCRTAPGTRENCRKWTMAAAQRQLGMTKPRRPAASPALFAEQADLRGCSWMSWGRRAHPSTHQQGTRSTGACFYSWGRTPVKSEAKEPWAAGFLPARRVMILIQAKFLLFHPSAFRLYVEKHARIDFRPEARTHGSTSGLL